MTRSLARWLLVDRRISRRSKRATCGLCAFAITSSTATGRTGVCVCVARPICRIGWLATDQCRSTSLPATLAGVRCRPDPHIGGIHRRGRWCARVPSESDGDWRAVGGGRLRCVAREAGRQAGFGFNLFSSSGVE